jgi:hypothetical protein
MERIQKERIQPDGDAVALYHIVYKHEGQIMGNPPVKFRYLVIYVAQAIGRRSILSPSLLKIILPVLLGNVEIPSILRDTVYLDLRDRNIKKGVNKIAEAIRLQKK